jgi:hypothetical protein
VTEREPTATSRLRGGPHLGAIVALSAWSLGTWWRSRGPSGPTLPFWAGDADGVLFGPDAGAWASNAWAIHLGRMADVDPHRLPAWPTLVAGWLHVVPDVALAGHLLNHLLFALLPLVTYAAALPLAGRAGACVAGFGVMWLAPVYQASHQSSADPLIAMAPVAALAAAHLAGRRPWLAPLAGLVVAGATVTHLTTLGVAVPAVLFALATGTPGRTRWIGAAALAASLAAALALAVHSYPTLEPGVFLNALAEGVTRPRAYDAAGDPLADQGAAIARVQHALPAAMASATRWLLGELTPSWLPLGAAVALPWLALAPVAGGVAGGGTPRPRRSARHAALLGTLAWRVVAGVAALGMLAPVVAFAAADAPSRYGANFLPVALVACVAGLAVVGGAVDALAARAVRRWPAGLVTLLLGAAWIAGGHDPVRRPLRPLRPSPDDMDAQALGARLAAHFPPGGGAAVMLREAAAVAGRVYCPRVGCPGAGTWDVTACLPRSFDAQCTGDGPIPWVVTERRDASGPDGTPPWRTEFDAWVVANHAPVDTVEGLRTRSRIYALPRP